MARKAQAAIFGGNPGKIMMTPAVMEAAPRRIVSDRKIRRWLPWMIMGLGIAIRLMLLRMPGYAGDVDDYLLWSRQMVRAASPRRIPLKSQS